MSLLLRRRKRRKSQLLTNLGMLYSAFMTRPSSQLKLLAVILLSADMSCSSPILFNLLVQGAVNG